MSSYEKDPDGPRLSKAAPVSAPPLATDIVNLVRNELNLNYTREQIIQDVEFLLKEALNANMR